MSGPAFTPGPWWVDDPDCAGCVDIMAGSNIVVCELDGHCCDINANARLIAAAPDGYEAAGAFVMAAINEYDIPEDADEGWIVDTLGHALGDAYLKVVAFRAKARGEQ